MLLSRLLVELGLRDDLMTEEERRDFARTSDGLEEQVRLLKVQLHMNRQQRRQAAREQWRRSRITSATHAEPGE